MNKVSEKAVWSGLVPSENITTTPIKEEQLTSPAQRCYKCNAILPDTSDFCPSCGIKLYVSCPKCQLVYSSQYAFCRKCGTNREEYLKEQERLEEERKLAQEMKRIECKAQKKKREEEEVRIKAENEYIMKTAEYNEVYKFLLNTRRNYMIILISIVIISFPTMVFLNVTYVNHILWVFAWIAIYMLFIFSILFHFDFILRIIMIKRSKKCKYPKICMHVAHNYVSTPYCFEIHSTQFKRLIIRAYRANGSIEQRS